MVKSRFGNLDTDINLGGDNAQDDIIASQKAVKTYIDNNKGGGTLEELSDVNISNPTQGQNLTYDATNNVWKNTSTTATVAWGGITGNIEDQSDLNNALNDKQDELTSENAGENILITEHPGKNLFDKNTMFLHMAILSAIRGSITIGANYLSAYFPIESGKTYTVSRAEGSTNNRFACSLMKIDPSTITSSMEGILFKEDGVTYGYAVPTSDNLSMTFTPQNSELKYALIYLSNASGSTSQVVDLQAEEGDTPTPYEPYFKGIKISATVPAKTSDLVNDSGFIDSSALDGYATETYVDNHHDSTKQDVINDLETIRSKANSALQQSDIINNVTSTATNKTLSANMGKELQDQITALTGRGTYLSVWNCTTGLAMTTPTVIPRVYKTGDWFLVGYVGTTNYKPTGTSYNPSIPSTEVETNPVKVNDAYYFDGEVWTLLDTPQVDVAFSTLAGSPYDNTNLSNALNDKQDELTAGDNIQITNNVISATDTTYSTGTKTKAGITKLYDDLGSNTDGALTQNVASNNLVNYNTVNQELNSFADTNKIYWLSSIHNAFYKADQRFNVSLTGFSSGSIDRLFNASFEDHNNVIANGDTGVVTISRTGTSGGITGTYTQGWLYLSFYYNRAPLNLSQLTVKYKPRASETIKTRTVEEVCRKTISGISYIEVVRCLISSEGAQWIEITIDNTDGTEETTPNGISLAEVEFFETRPNGIKDFPVVTKYTNSEIYGNLTATSFIKKGGTSSQFLKADGSLDSNAYITSSYHDNTKQNITDNTLTTTAKTIVGAINEINAKPSGSVETDDVTINKNADDELQAIALMDSGDNTARKERYVTQAQYDAMKEAGTLDDDTYYNTPQDVSLSLLEAVYPVGSIYITTNATCPLSALFGTWQIVASDRVLQGAGTRGSVGTTLEESLPNIKGDVSQKNATGMTDGAAIYDGAFYKSSVQFSNKPAIAVSGTGYSLGFDASLSYSTYQDNAPVQQDAYLVNIFRRIS